MATIVLTVLVPNVAEVHQTFDRIKVYRSVTGMSGVYTELTVPATRIVLESTKTSYRFVDAQGDRNYYYKVSYFNATTTAESSLSDAQQGDTDDALDILSVAELKQIYLFGVDLTNDYGEPYPEIVFEHGIRQAVSYIEHRLDIPLRPTLIEDERHDFYIQDWNKFIWIQTDKRPILSVDSIRLILPTEIEAVRFKQEWWQVDKATGVINIIPGVGQVALGIGQWIQLIRGGLDFLPDVLRITYTAGFEAGKCPEIIKEVVGKLAAFGPLNLAGDMIGGAGIASKSISIDGLSQAISTTSSPTMAGYSGRLLRYDNELKTAIPALERYYHGNRLRVA